MNRLNRTTLKLGVRGKLHLRAFLGGCLILVLWGCTPVALPPTAPETRTIPLRIVTYNTHLLPGYALKLAGDRGEPSYRAKTIPAKLGDYDIIGICEAFDPGYTQALLDGFHASAPSRFHVARSAKSTRGHVLGSGLLILSRFPIEETNSITFKHASRFLSSGFKADGFAGKGALHARIRLGDDQHSVVDCFVTHLESRSKSSRQKQIAELSKFISAHSTQGVPMMVLGDFNISAQIWRKDRPPAVNASYRGLRTALVHNARYLVDVWQAIGDGPGGTSKPNADDGGKRIDYIFLSDSNDTEHPRIVPSEVRVLRLLDASVPEGSLSDHSAVACDAEFHWPANETGTVRTPSSGPR